MYFYVIALGIIILDQFFKQLVHFYMQLGQSIPVVNGILRLTYVRNTGAAFSLFVGFSPYLVVVGIIVVGAVIYFHYKMPGKDLYIQSALACILGGSLGNLLDRIFRSYVIDYIDIIKWPVFNFADIMINLGVILIALKLFEAEAHEIKEEREEHKFIEGLEHVSNTD
jgi:signal peptidase II